MAAAAAVTVAALARRWESKVAWWRWFALDEPIQRQAALASLQWPSELWSEHVLPQLAIHGEPKSVAAREAALVWLAEPQSL